MKVETDDLFLNYLDEIHEGRNPDLTMPPYNADPDLPDKVKKYKRVEDMLRQARAGKAEGPVYIDIPGLKIVRLLGQGMGRVYLAQDHSLDRQVAVKIIPKFDNDQVIRRFQQESKILARFTHPNIVVIHSHGDTDDFFYYVMQYLEGLTLDKIIRYLKENRFARASDVFQFVTGRLTDLPAKNRLRTILDGDYFRQIVDIARQACDGLAAAHRERVIHRDVKPQNILFDTHGMVKLMDFGISKLADGSIRTRTHEMLGSPFYISPEMIDKREITERTDVYSLGVVLYELLALRVPFDDETLDSLYRSISQTPAPDLRAANSDIPPAIADIVHTCLKKDPGERYRTMKELKSELDRVFEAAAVDRRRSERRADSMPVRRDCTSSDLARLIQFYLACIEEEDRRSMRLDLVQHRQSFISPWDDAEPMFHPDAPEVRFRPRAEDQALLTRGAARAGPADRFYYGYPVMVDDRDRIAPLFVAEVEVAPVADGGFVMRPVDPNAFTVNHHIFAERHFAAEEISVIVNELEGSFGSFAARLRAAIEHLGLDAALFKPDRVVPLPDGRSSSRGWINRPILFRSDKSQYVANLRKELETLLSADGLLERAMETALGPILDPGGQPARCDGEAGIPVLEILPLNDRQELAAQAGLSRALTAVTGPPGTGKSQVVVNLMASCAAAGKPVLFASKNNKAVDVVHERLREILGEDDWTLRLGNSQRMEESGKEIARRLSALAGLARQPQPGSSAEDLARLDRDIAGVRERMKRMEDDQAGLRRAEQDTLTASESVPADWMEATDLENPPDVPRAAAQRAYDDAKALAGLAPMGLWLRIRRFVMGGRLASNLRNRYLECARFAPDAVKRAGATQDAGTQATAARNGVPDATAPPTPNDRERPFRSIALAFQKLLAYSAWLESRRSVRNASDALRAHPTAAALQAEWQNFKRNKTDMSRDHLKAAWTGRIREKQEVAVHFARRFFDLAARMRYNKSGPQAKRMMADFGDTIRQLGSFMPVWIVTNLSVKRALPLEPGLFDLVIIDESSQCDIASAIPLLFRAKRALVIGDPQQLRHISGIGMERESHIASQLGAEDLLTDWSYAGNSLYDAVEAAVISRGASPAEDGKSSAAAIGPPVFLAEHYRSHPDVIEFSNRVFYQGRLVLRTSVPALKEKLLGQPIGVFWRDVKGIVPDSRKSASNDAEAAAVVALLDDWRRAGLFQKKNLTFGVVTPFRGQMEIIEEAVRRQPWWAEVKGRLTVGTAHLFQGDECDLMIFSPVVSDGIADRLAKWVASTDQLLNVAVTRARGAMHVVGNLDACKKAGGYLGEFADYVDSGFVSGRTPADIVEPSESKMAELLQKAGLWYHHHFKEGRAELDFLVVSPFGARYDIEVDGMRHLSPETLRADRVRDKRLEAAGYRVVRIPARDLTTREPAILDLLTRLI